MIFLERAGVTLQPIWWTSFIPVFPKL